MTLAARVYSEPKRGEWRQRDGSTIPITLMGDSHLLNTITMLERNAPAYAFSLAMSAGNYADQHDSMGGLAADEASDGFFELMDEARESPADAARVARQLFPKYAELVAERKRRGLHKPKTGA